MEEKKKLGTDRAGKRGVWQCDCCLTVDLTVVAGIGLDSRRKILRNGEILDGEVIGGGMRVRVGGEPAVDLSYWKSGSGLFELLCRGSVVGPVEWHQTRTGIQLASNERAEKKDAVGTV